jgi:hypothetical protein
MAPTLARLNPLTPFRYFRGSYRLELIARTAEARAREAEAQQSLAVAAILGAGRALERAEMAAAP